MAGARARAPLGDRLVGSARRLARSVEAGRQQYRTFLAISGLMLLVALALLWRACGWRAALLWAWMPLVIAVLAVVGVRGWHSERISAVMIEKDPDLLRFVEPDALRVAASRVGADTVARILCIPQLPATVAAFHHSAQFHRAAGRRRDEHHAGEPRRADPRDQRAQGAGRADIIVQFLSEASALTLAGERSG